MVIAAGSYPAGRWFESDRRYQFDKYHLRSMMASEESSTTWDTKVRNIDGIGHPTDNNHLRVNEALWSSG